MRMLWLARGRDQKCSHFASYCTDRMDPLALVVEGLEEWHHSSIDCHIDLDSRSMEVVRRADRDDKRTALDDIGRHWTQGEIESSHIRYGSIGSCCCYPSRPDVVLELPAACIRLVLFSPPALGKRCCSSCCSCSFISLKVVIALPPGSNIMGDAFDVFSLAFSRVLRREV